LSSNLGTSTGLFDVCWTRTTIGGPNYLGGSVTAGIGAKPFSADIMRHLQKDFLKVLSRAGQKTRGSVTRSTRLISDSTRLDSFKMSHEPS
jgi:hypothetical protein